MVSYESHISVARPPEEVFATIVDFRTWSRWTDMDDVRPDDDGPPRLGSGGTFRMTKGPFKQPARYELVELEPGRRGVWRVTHPAFEWRAEMRTETEAGGTRLTNAGRMQLRGVWRLLSPLIGRELGSNEARELDRIKAMLESEPTHAGEPARSE
jgi:uncharacterized protein YndB with AHSA1/START domain